MKEECSSYKNTATGWKLYCVVYIGIKGKVVKLCRWIKFGQCDVRVPETTKHLAPCIARFSQVIFFSLY